MTDSQSAETTFDVIVIGAGSAGVRFARTAAKLGAKVAVVEERYLGGTCVNVGCVPKKMFVYGSQIPSQLETGQAYGWQAESLEFHWQTLLANKNREIERLNQVYGRLLNESGVALINGSANIVSEQSVRVDNTVYHAERIVIAVGGWPTIPDIEGKEHFVTSNELFYLTSLPKKAVILGGGYIAVEFAGILNGLGVDTTLVYRGEQLLRGFDDEVRSHLAEAIQARGVTITLNTNIESIEAIKELGEPYRVSLDNGQHIDTDLVVAATGRHPKLSGLGVESINLALTEKGFIKVDDHFQTNIPSVFALGDVVGRMALTPVALEEAMVLADNLFGKKANRTMDYQNIATAVFSQPEIATIGLTEAEAQQQYGEIDLYRSTFTPLKQSLGGKKEKSLVKLIVDKKSDKVVGLHMVGSDVAEIVQGFAVAMKMGATKADFDATVGVHPTLAEELVTMR